MDRNRDYFARPVQDSRSAHDYGRSGPIYSDHAEAVTWTQLFAVAVSVAFVTYIIWQFCR